MGHTLNDKRFLSYVQIATGRFAKASTPIIPPAAYKDEVISENHHAFDVNCAVANKVYSLGVPAGVIDGTNQYAVMELTLSLPENTANPEAVIIKVYRESTADGQDAATDAIVEKAMVSGSRVYIPVKPEWGLLAVKIASSSALHIYGDVVGIHYTPGS